MSDFAKTLIGRIVIGLLAALIVMGIIALIRSNKTYNLAGVWKIKMDYDIFFSNHISKYKQCKILADGDFYLVKESDGYKGLSLLEISLSPENLSEKQKMITLVLDFHSFDEIKLNNFKGNVSVRLRQVETEVIKKFILSFLIDQKELNVPSNYSFTLNMESINHGTGTFEGKLNDGTITTKGSLELIKWQILNF